jgi:2-oxoisovalerate dehydrogenase E1 component alpha subunit
MQTEKETSPPPLLPPDPALQVAIYRDMVRTAALDARLWALNRQGKAPLVVSCRGHEAVQVASARALDPSRDLFFTYYRDLGVCLALGVTPLEVLLGALARADDPFSGGRQFPLHGAYPARRIINPSNVVAGHLTEAAGAALAAKMRRTGGLVIAYFGDGAASQGECHEAMNFAAVHHLPLIFLCENNRYATSVPLHLQMGTETLAARAAAYAMPDATVDGADIAAVYEAVARAAAAARAGEGPTLIDAQVERLMPHTSSDDDRRYRTAEELEAARARDPLALIAARLLAEGWATAEDIETWRAEAQQEVDTATREAESSPEPAPDTLHRHVYQ